MLTRCCVCAVAPAATWSRLRGSIPKWTVLVAGRFVVHDTTARLSSAYSTVGPLVIRTLEAAAGAGFGVTVCAIAQGKRLATNTTTIHLRIHTSILWLEPEGWTYVAGQGMPATARTARAGT